MWDCNLEKSAAAIAAGCKIVPNKSKMAGRNNYFYNGTAVVSYLTIIL